MPESKPVNQGLTLNRHFRAWLIFLIFAGALFVPFVFRMSKAALLAFILIHGVTAIALVAVAVFAYKKRSQGDSRSARRIMDEFFRP
jgi:hypothetical protein